MLRRISHVALILALAVLTLALPASAADLQTGLDAFLSQLSADFETVAGKTVVAKQNAGENLFVLDVREPDEFRAGRVEGAVNVPIRTLAQNVAKLPQDKATPSYGDRGRSPNELVLVDRNGGPLTWVPDSLSERI